MAEYSRIASGVVTTLAGGGTAPINLPFVPNRIKMVNVDAIDDGADGDVVYAQWFSPMGQGTAAYDVLDTGNLQPRLASSGGFYTFAAGQVLQFGAKKQVVASTKGTTTNFQVTAHGYVDGDVVVFQGLYQSPTTGMVQMSGMPFTVSVVDANNFRVNWNSNTSNYTNLSGSPSGATVMQVLFPSLYIPGISFIEAITLGTTTTISTTTPHLLKVGQEVAFRIPPVWGTSQLNSLPNAVIPGSPIYGYVVAVSDAFNVVVSIDSSAFTAFNANQPIASVVGLTFPQMVPVGDVNTGGFPIYSGSPLYPPPTYLGATGQFSTINGPAIQGAFVNNTSQGFIIGPTVATGNEFTIYWEAYLDDITQY